MNREEFVKEASDVSLPYVEALTKKLRDTVSQYLEFLENSEQRPMSLFWPAIIQASCIEMLRHSVTFEVSVGISKDKYEKLVKTIMGNLEQECLGFYDEYHSKGDKGGGIQQG